MPNRILDYPEAVGRTVAKLTITNESDWRNISVTFTDKTAIHIRIVPRLAMEPEYLDWKTGDGEVLRSYPVVHEREG